MSVAVKERPILFSGPMVRAILAGRKTQTRRIMKPQYDGHRLIGPEWYEPAIEGKDGELRDGKPIFGVYDEHGEFGIKCPFEPNMRLWVRETWRANECFDQKSPSQIAEGAMRAGYDVTHPYTACDLWYEADGAYRPWKLVEHPKKGKTRVSIHMPRWASRITLEITGVRIERLQEINNADCVAEGIEPIGRETEIGKCCGQAVMTQVGNLEGRYSTVRQLYSELWTDINGPDSWAANPWVWVVQFQRVEAGK